MAAGNGSALVDVRTMRKALREARGKHKLDLLLSTDEPAKLVRSLPPEDLYLALLDIGPDDAAEVVALASPEQFRHFVDMSAWRGGDEGPRTSEVLRWLRLSREGGGDAGRMRFRYQLSGLDVELLALVLRRGMKVYDLGEDQDPREQSAELEEAARRWRDGRLRDLGVPDFEEAISFYARPASRAPAPPMAAPQTQALTAPQGNLMDAALELLSGEELELAEESAVYAANAALVANRVPLDDPDEVREQLADARATLSLGLELLSGGDPVRASRVLVELPIRQLFQTAMGEAYRLQTRARKVAQAARLPQAQSATLLDEPLESAVQALLKPRPLFHEPGKRRPRAFATRADVAAVEAMLDEAEAVVALLSALGIPPAVLGPKADEAEVGAAALKASSALRALIESRIAGVPLSLRSVGDENHPLPSGFEQRLDEALQNATGGFPTDTLARAAQRLRSSLTR